MPTERSCWWMVGILEEYEEYVKMIDVRSKKKDRDISKQQTKANWKKLRGEKKTDPGVQKPSQSMRFG